MSADDKLLRQALEALEMSAGYLDELSSRLFDGPKMPKPGSTSWYVGRAIAALRERLVPQQKEQA